MHLIGNLNTYIGAELGKTGYIRDRDAEFSLKNVPRQTLLTQLDDTLLAVEVGPQNAIITFFRKFTGTSPGAFSGEVD